MLIQIRILPLTFSRFGGPSNFDADPDPGPDSAFHFDADPDADQDPHNAYHSNTMQLHTTA